MYRAHIECIGRRQKVEVASGHKVAVQLASHLTMPGKCKFQDSWLSKGIYKEWLLKDLQDIHFARCRACCKSIKLQTMGEAALTSHAGGAGHKAAVRKLVEGSLATVFQKACQKWSALSVSGCDTDWSSLAVCSAGVTAGCVVAADWYWCVRTCVCVVSPTAVLTSVAGPQPQLHLWTCCLYVHV